MFSFFQLIWLLFVCNLEEWDWEDSWERQRSLFFCPTSFFNHVTRLLSFHRHHHHHYRHYYHHCHHHHHHLRPFFCLTSFSMFSLLFFLIALSKQFCNIPLCLFVQISHLVFQLIFVSNLVNWDQKDSWGGTEAIILLPQFSLSFFIFIIIANVIINSNSYIIISNSCIIINISNVIIRWYYLLPHFLITFFTVHPRL